MYTYSPCFEMGMCSWKKTCRVNRCKANLNSILLRKSRDVFLTSPKLPLFSIMPWKKKCTQQYCRDDLYKEPLRRSYLSLRASVSDRDFPLRLPKCFPYSQSKYISLVIFPAFSELDWAIVILIFSALFLIFVLDSFLLYTHLREAADSLLSSCLIISSFI